VSFALIAGYVLSLVYQFTNPDKTLGGRESRPAMAARRGPQRGGHRAAARCRAARSPVEILVDSIDTFIDAFGLTPFVGVVIPTIGNLAEHLRCSSPPKQDGVRDGGLLGRACRWPSCRPVLVLLGVVMGQYGPGLQPLGLRGRRRRRDQR
jgi:hypothetical protein